MFRICKILTLSITLLASCLPQRSSQLRADGQGQEYLQRLATKDDFTKLAGKLPGGQSAVKFTLFKTSGDMYFQDTTKFPYHLNFLNAHFPEYKTLNMQGFENLIFSEPPTLLAGGLYWLDQFTAADLATPGIVGFNTYFASNGGEPGFSVEYVKIVHKRLAETVGFSPEKIVYIFESPKAFFKYRSVLAQVGIKSYPVAAIIDKSENSRVYNAAKTYGYLRKIGAAEFAAGDYTSKDILIFDEVPIDIGPVAGVISLQPQVPHSHVIFRSVNLKIPDVYIPNGLSNGAISSNLGKLVELETRGESEWFLKGANEIPNITQLADAYFAQRVPNLPEPRANLQENQFFDLGAGSASTALLDRYGAKGSYFAILDQALRTSGVDRYFAKGAFLIPYSYNASHMQQKLTAKLCTKAIEKCSADFGDQCSAAAKICSEVSSRGGSLRDFAGSISSREFSAAMLAQGKLRKASLSVLQYVIRKTPLIPENLVQIKDRIAKTWDATTRIRFRSSSNAEDLPGLTGAGLYSSHSGCLADEGGREGESSRCMTPLERSRITELVGKLRSLNRPELAALIKDLEDKLKDQDLIEDAVRKVFASLWNERAFLSRDYYRIPHERIYMAVLVHPSFADDSANGVAVIEKAGDGVRLDIVVQKDDISITNPEIPGAIPDEFVVVAGANGAIGSPQYLLHSNQVPQGTTVLNSEQVSDIARQLVIVDRAFAQAGVASTGRLDIEIKRNAKGQMQVKQARSL